MTIALTFLGIHLLNIAFIFFTIARIAAKNGLENAYNIHYLLWLFRHPLLNCLVILSIFIQGEEGLTAICKKRIEKE